jgi:hypothetical protein
MHIKNRDRLPTSKKDNVNCSCYFCIASDRLPTSKKDNVNPSHYKSGEVECIDAIKSSMSKDEFQGALKANILKYIWRFPKKKGIEDLYKAKWYLSRLISECEKGEVK